ncbi:MAG TPA: hypothetical protein PLO37_25700 [Candidatus Hydrogenedentes bacterium]|nr:hypothetical protein [Candidatus Hydrogenedentota bacterium]HPG70252.1 hypothetical protein [Candidatus Hydrogenedentota bacterium]
MLKKRLLALAGVILVWVGVFSPALRMKPMQYSFSETMRVLELFGGINLLELKQEMNVFEFTAPLRRYDTGAKEGWALAVLATLAFAMALFKRKKLLWLFALATTGALGFTVTNLMINRAEIERKLADVPDLAYKVIHSTEPLRGWWPLLFGVLCLLVAAAWPSPRPDADDDEEEDGGAGGGGVDGRSEATQRMVRYKMGEGVIPRATD